MTAVRFGVDISTSAAAGADPVRDARLAEELGFDFVSCSDHPSGTHPTYESWTLLTWVAASTTRIGVTTRVLGVPFRSPAVLAKMAESLDRLSGGRLVLGLGAGAVAGEMEGFGVPPATAGDRLRGLADAVRIVRGLWSEPSFTYRGDVYQVSDAPCEPKPARPVPIWLGTFGDRALALTGQLADGWIPSLGYRPEDQLPKMRRKVLDAAERAGRDPSALTCVLNLVVGLDGRPSAEEDRVVGPGQWVAERLAGLVESGFDAFNLVPAPPRDPDDLRRIASEVLPLVRRAAG